MQVVNIAIVAPGLAGTIALRYSKNMTAGTLPDTVNWQVKHLYTGTSISKQPIFDIQKNITYIVYCM